MKKIMAILLLSSSLLNLGSNIPGLPEKTSLEIKTALSKFTPAQQLKFGASAAKKMGEAINAQAKDIPAVQSGCIQAQKEAAQQLKIPEGITPDKLDTATASQFVALTNKIESQISMEKFLTEDPEYLKMFKGAGAFITQFMNEAIAQEKEQKAKDKAARKAFARRMFSRKKNKKQQTRQPTK